MNKKRNVNTKLLQKWADNTVNPILTLAHSCGCSEPMARQLLNGTYNNGNAPKVFFRKSISEFVGIDENKLFPLAK